MSHRALRELAKIAVGIFIADIACAIWLGTAGLLPVTILGITWTASYIVPGIVFDVAVILLLAHYAWGTTLPAAPSERSLLLVAGIIFLAVAIAHLLRLALGVTILFGTFALPAWLSWMGVIVTAYLSYASFHFALARRR